MKRLIAIAPVLLLLIAGLPPVDAGPVLFEYAINLDGTVWHEPMPGAVNLSAFDSITGLGTIRVTVSGAGSHSVLAFFDHEIDEDVNGFSNEMAAAAGALATGLSWEIDEPGYVFGDIYGNFVAGALDNSGIPGPEDISMALGWSFTLPDAQPATVSFLLSNTAPQSGFYLHQWDPEGGDVYLSTVLGTSYIPEPSYFLAIGVVLSGVAMARRRRRRNHPAPE